MSTIHLNNVDYYYEQHGKGPPLLLIAGYSSDHTFWDNIANELIKQFTVVRFDNRGIGQTRDDQKSFTIEMMANDTIQLINALDLKNVCIVGHSMGGIIAQIIAKKAPNQLSHLILLNSAKAINCRSLMALEMFLLLLEEQAPIETVIQASFPWFFSPAFLKNKKNIKMMKEKIMNNPYPQRLFDLRRQFNALRKYTGLEEQNTKIPTLILTSYEDILCPPSESEALKAAMPLSTFLTIPSGHSSPIEQPLAVLEVIEKFLIQHSIR